MTLFNDGAKEHSDREKFLHDTRYFYSMGLMHDIEHKVRDIVDHYDPLCWFCRSAAGKDPAKLTKDDICETHLRILYKHAQTEKKE